MRPLSSSNGAIPSSTILPLGFDHDEAAAHAVRELDEGKTLAAHRMVKAGFGPIHTSHIKVARAIKQSAEDHLREVVDPWLADCPPLPPARVPQWNERGGR